MIPFLIIAIPVFAYIAGFYSGARFVSPRRTRPNLYVTYQPTDREKRQFANYVDVMDVPAVRRRQQIPVVRP